MLAAPFTSLGFVGLGLSGRQAGLGLGPTGCALQTIGVVGRPGTELLGIEAGLGTALIQRHRVPGGGIVYVLICEDEKYYVGHSQQLHTRLQQHFKGGASKFTRKHRPCSVLAYFPGDKKLEYKTWKTYANLFGEENVGGYTWSCARYLQTRHL